MNDTLIYAMGFATPFLILFLAALALTARDNAKAALRRRRLTRRRQIRSDAFDAGYRQGLDHGSRRYR